MTDVVSNVATEPGFTEFVSTGLQGGVAYLTLTRPQALNALSLEMIRAMTAALTRWEADPAVHAVVVAGAGGKAFCAGGDIRWFHKAYHEADPLLDQFFVEEYALNYLIHRYTKPYIALMDGVVMGGGMGISQGAKLRIVTDRTKMAMPETNIGLFPDVGGGWFLARTPGHIGEYLGLTGVVIAAADALYAKLADAFLPTNALAELVASLQAQSFNSGDAVLAHVSTFTQQHAGACVPAESQLAHQAEAIDSLFGRATVRDILDGVSDAAGDWAAQTAAMLRSRSPMMLCVTLEQVRRARSMSLADELRMELDMMHDVFRHGDGVEGIRALAIDKDHQPRWNPVRLDEVTPGRVRAFFDSKWKAEDHPLAALGR